MLAHLAAPKISVLATSFTKKPLKIQGNTPWVAPACADCPDFLVLGSAPAPTATLVSEPQIVPLASILLYGPSEIVWICCPQLPYHRAKTGRTAHGFTAQGGTRRKLKALETPTLEVAQENLRGLSPALTSLTSSMQRD